jgi:hypothetical protein
MRQAAETLIAVSGLYDAAYPSEYPWTAAELLREAPHVESEDTE